MSDKPLDGGCLCGAVRYRLARPPRIVGHCHCRLCQRAAGAPVVTWLVVRRGDFAVTQGAPATYRSSDHAERDFCSGCGTQLIFRDDNRPDHLDVTVATLDAPEAVTPTFEIWTDSRQPWLHLDGVAQSYARERS